MTKSVLPPIGCEVTVKVKQQNYYIMDTSSEWKYYTYTGTVLPNEDFQLPGTFRMTGDGDRIPVRVIDIDNVVNIVVEGQKLQGIVKKPTKVINTKVASSKGDGYYNVRVYPNGVGKCTCLGFTYRGNCRHMKKVLLTLNQM